MVKPRYINNEVIVPKPGPRQIKAITLVFIVCYLLASCFARTIINAQEKKLHRTTPTIQALSSTNQAQ